MIGLIAVAASAGAALGATWLAAAREHEKLKLTFLPDEMHWARTDDGWELPLGRYLAKGARAVAEPVILCHGMGANRFNLDLNETYSVARHLARHGFECFVIELRGSGLARRWKPGKHYAFRFDDLVTIDLPALIGKAREVAGSERVLWVGHSKGGVVMYAYCGSADRPEVAGVVAIGSPLITDDYVPPGMKRAMLALDRLTFLDAIHLGPPVKALATLATRVQIPFQYMARQENMEPEVTGMAMANLLGNISTGITRQFARWIETGRFTSWDGRIDYRAGLAHSKVPFLLIAGTEDLLAPPSSLEAAREAMVEAREAGLVEYLLCGKETGFSCDYGHGDLVLGRSAPKEIFPRIEAWLRKRGSRP